MAACVRSRENSARRELSFGRLVCTFSDCERCSSSRMVERRKPAFVQNLRGETLLFAQEAEQQMLRADVLVVQTLSFFGAIGEDALALVAERKIDRSRNLLANRGVTFDLLPDGIDGRVRPQKPIRQLFVFPQEAEQQMLGLDVGAAKLARLVPGEENYAPRLFRVTLKHLVWILPYRSAYT